MRASAGTHQPLHPHVGRHRRSNRIQVGQHSAAARGAARKQQALGPAAGAEAVVLRQRSDRSRHDAAAAKRKSERGAAGRRVAEPRVARAVPAEAVVSDCRPRTVKISSPLVRRARRHALEEDHVGVGKRIVGLHRAEDTVLSEQLAPPGGAPVNCGRDSARRQVSTRKRTAITVSAWRTYQT